MTHGYLMVGGITHGIDHGVGDHLDGTAGAGDMEDLIIHGNLTVGTAMGTRPITAIILAIPMAIGAIPILDIATTHMDIVREDEVIPIISKTLEAVDMLQQRPIPRIV